jgi:hypothetical protein
MNRVWWQWHFRRRTSRQDPIYLVGNGVPSVSNVTGRPTCCRARFGSYNLRLILVHAVLIKLISVRFVTGMVNVPSPSYGVQLNAGPERYEPRPHPLLTRRFWSRMGSIPSSSTVDEPVCVPWVSHVLRPYPLLMLDRNGMSPAPILY